MDDKDIIDLLNNRDQRAITELNTKYGKYCLSISNNILSDYGDSAECVNDVLLTIWNSIPPEAPSSLKGYIGKITRNLSISMYRSKNAQKRGGSMVVKALEELETEVTSGIDLENEYVKKEMISALNEILNSLPGRERQIFIQRYYFFRSAEQIGDSFGLTSQNVRMILSRVRKRIKDELQKREWL